MKTAIIGCSDSAQLAPWDDSTWLKWGLRQDNKYWTRLDAMFEIHRNWDDMPKARERLESVDVPIYMTNPNGIAAISYPLEGVFSVVSRYLTSSVGYMIALAIYQNAKEIGIWGVDLNENRHNHQRANLEYLIGIAKGKGIKVTIPESCPLLKAPVYCVATIPTTTNG